MSDLHAQPDSRAVAAQLAKTHRHLRGYGRLLRQDSVQRLTRDAEVCRSVLHGQAQRWQNHVPKQLSRMTGAPSRWSLNFIFSHLPNRPESPPTYRTDFMLHVKVRLTQRQESLYTRRDDSILPKPRAGRVLAKP